MTRPELSPTVEGNDDEETCDILLMADAGRYCSSSTSSSELMHPPTPCTCTPEEEEEEEAFSPDETIFNSQTMPSKSFRPSHHHHHHHHHHHRRRPHHAHIFHYSLLIILLHLANLCNSQLSPSTSDTSTIITSSSRTTSTVSSFLAASPVGIEPLYHRVFNGRPVRSYSEEFMSSSEERERNSQFFGGGMTAAAAAAAGAAGATSTGSTGGGNIVTGNRRVVPHFDVESLSTNVTISEGSAFVHLPCRVKQLGERTLSWIRRKDFQILTVGKFTYTSDQRFQVIHLDNTDDWSLQISYPQKKDAGIYECQVATMPKISLFVQLNVVVSRAKILESPTLYLSSGTTLNLTCIVRDTPEPPDYIFWYYNGQVINYGSPRGIKVTVEKGAATVSRLVVEQAQPNDSGNYSCTPANAEPAHIAVHVQSNTNPAASLQHGKRSASREFGSAASPVASLDKAQVMLVVVASLVAAAVAHLRGLLIQC